MSEPPPPQSSLIDSQPPGLMRAAVLFQGGLTLLGIAVGLIFGFHDPSQGLLDFGWSSVVKPALIWGGLGTIPMLGYLVFAHFCPWGPLKAIRDVVEEKLLPLLRHCTLLDMVILALLAGLSEELLFRWCLQGGLTQLTHPLFGERSWVFGLLVSSLLFGALHCINASYVFVTTLVGFYLGWLMIASGTYLAPAVSHALFDFVAFYYIIRILPKSAGAQVPS